PAPGYLLAAVYSPTFLPDWPALAMRRADDLLELCAHVMGASWGCAFGTRERIAAEQQVRADPRDPFPDFLPAIRPPDEMPDILTPPHLGWVNYWSSETCARVGFPPAEGSLPFVRGVRPTGDGGYIWRVTDDVMSLLHK